MLNSIRVRLTLWCLLGFGSLLAGFSAYIYTSLARDLTEEFDSSLLRTAQSVSNYFAEFVERKNLSAGAHETVREFRFERLGVAIFQGGSRSPQTARIRLRRSQPLKFSRSWAPRKCMRS